MKRLVLIGFSGLALAACATASTPGPAKGPTPAPATPAPVVRPVTPPPAPVYEPPAPNCRADQHQHLVGRPRSEIPVPTDPSRQRVACTTCPVTQDYREDRLNFFFDADTGIVKEVRCG